MELILSASGVRMSQLTDFSKLDISKELDGG